MKFDAMSAVTGPYGRHILQGALGADAASVLNGQPLPDFGGHHPDPNLVHAKVIYDLAMLPDGPDFCAASDGDGDRNLIIGRGQFVTPSDSLALLAANAHLAPGYADGLKGIVADYPNVVVVIDDYTKMTNLPEKPDVIWTTENYHDFHNANADMGPFNKAMFDALKPGGVFFVEDHAAAPGAGLTVTKTLHRIDPASVQAEVTAAGFKLARTSDILHHAEDEHTSQNAEAAIRGKTDRFMFVFQKP
jgi:SAM-dependent methyltransferase